MHACIHTCINCICVMHLVCILLGPHIQHFYLLTFYFLFSIIWGGAEMSLAWPTSPNQFSDSYSLKYKVCKVGRAEIFSAPLYMFHIITFNRFYFCLHLPNFSFFFLTISKDYSFTWCLFYIFQVFLSDLLNTKSWNNDKSVF